MTNAGIGETSSLCGMMLVSALQTQFTTVLQRERGRP